MPMTAMPRRRRRRAAIPAESSAELVEQDLVEHAAGDREAVLDHDPAARDHASDLPVGIESDEIGIEAGRDPALVREAGPGGDVRGHRPQRVDR
jgi:hypothetical protein